MGKGGWRVGPSFEFLKEAKTTTTNKCVQNVPYLGTQGVRVMNPPPPLASGSHCSNVRTLCSRLRARGGGWPSKFEGSVPSYGM